MRTLIIIACFLSIGSAAFAQNLDEVQNKITANLYSQAKQQIDQFLSDPANSNNYRAWYLKGKIYTQLLKADADNTITYDAGSEAFAAYKKYQQLDKNNTLMIADENVAYFGLYDAVYNKGIQLYNAKNYDNAFTKLKAAIEVEDYAAGKGYSYRGFTFPKLDTQLVNLAASSAYLAKRDDEAIPYFAKLADARLSNTDYKETYAILGEYYQKKNDPVNKNKYFDLGRKLFPGDDYWVAVELGDPGSDNSTRFKRYEEVSKKYPANYALALEYASEFFNYVYSYDSKPADYTVRRQKLDGILNKLLAIQSTAMADYIMSQHISNGIFDLEDESDAIKGNTPADEAARNRIKAVTNSAYEDLYKYSQAAYDLYTAQSSLQPNEKASLKKVTDQLAVYYERKKDNAKVIFYKEKSAALQ